MLDFVYSNIKDTYKAVPPPHIGTSDHIVVVLIPVYRPRVKLERPAIGKIRTWPQDAMETLQDCHL